MEVGKSSEKDRESIGGEGRSGNDRGKRRGKRRGKKKGKKDRKTSIYLPFSADCDIMGA